MSINYQGELNNIREEVEQLKGVIQIAQVSTISAEKRTARVVWENGDTSPYIPVLSRKIRCHGCGALGCTGNTLDWMPTVGQMVIVLYRPGGEGDGFILGGI